MASNTRVRSTTSYVITSMDCTSNSTSNTGTNGMRKCGRWLAPDVASFGRFFAKFPCHKQVQHMKFILNKQSPTNWQTKNRMASHHPTAASHGLCPCCQEEQEMPGWFVCLRCMLLYQPKKKVCWLHCVVTGRLIWPLIILQLSNEISCCATRRMSCLMLPYMAPAGFAIVSS